MSAFFFSVFFALRAGLRTRAALQTEVFALRHQLSVSQRSNHGRRFRLRATDRILGVWLSRLWAGWRSALVIVKPETVIAWHRQGFRFYWRWKWRHAEGRPTVSQELRELIRRMGLANPRWGAPRIHGELLKLGIQVSQATVAKYMGRHRKPPSQTWRIFLKNHMEDLVAADFFLVPTVTSNTQLHSYAFGSRQGCAGPTECPAAGNWTLRGATAGWRNPPSIRAACGLNRINFRIFNFILSSRGSSFARQHAARSAFFNQNGLMVGTDILAAGLRLSGPG